MITRRHLPRPRHYLPLAAAALAVIVLVPEGMIPGGDGTVDTAEAAGDAAQTPLVSIAAAAPPAAELGLQRPGTGTEVQPAVETAEVQPRVQPAAPAEVQPEPDPLRTAAVNPSTPLDPSVESEAMPAAPTDGYYLAAVDGRGAVGPMDDAVTDASRTGGSVTRVGDSALNVRSGPSSSSAKLFVLQPGEQVQVAEMDGGWARIVRANGESGWAYSRYLTGPSAGASDGDIASTTTPDRPRRNASTASVDRETAAPKAKERAPGTRYARIGSDVPARAGPSRNAPSLFVLPAGERVAIAEIRDGWAHVVLDGGVSGWVRYR